ncbi:MULTISPECIES: hypothetical protein [Bradyrhizobium]|uniref:Uncharacterized protein n=1 Tax=Bradyrhizobium aeschynomenes TaxID=2734909 RepID=A0ABX2CNU2_9BRAD|nr:MULTISPECIES: hypothetical protein [Bradyrhizobium]NPU69080.1 hypothetical protein [Bradyrhizobium aeschynomenes]
MTVLLSPLCCLRSQPGALAQYATAIDVITTASARWIAAVKPATTAEGGVRR